MAQPTTWDKEELFVTGDTYFKGLLTAIALARHTIEFETYIFEKGLAATRVADALTAAAQRGVKVRMVVDGWGSPDFSHDFLPRLQAHKVTVRFFRVSPMIIERLPGDPKSLIQRLLRRWQQVNRGNHRKFCLIDRTHLWVGSFNVSDVHLEEVFGKDAWKDMGVHVQGEATRYAYRAFERAIRGWTAINLPRRSPRLLLLNDSYIHKRRARLEIVQRLKRSKERMWLATPYFLPIGVIFRNLAKKAQQGVDVRLIVPRKNDVWFMTWLAQPMLYALANKGVKIFIYQPRFAHQKLFIIDQWISIGSTNLNHRSFLHDLEMDVVITHPENKKLIVKNYLQDQSACVEYHPDDWHRLPLWQRALTALLLLGRNWA